MVIKASLAVMMGDLEMRVRVMMVRVMVMMMNLKILALHPSSTVIVL